VAWRSIEEDSPTLLRGILADGDPPAARGLTPAGLASLLQRSISWSLALGAHLALALVLISIYVHVRREEETVVEVGLHRGDGGGQQAPKPPDPAPAPEPPVEKPSPAPPAPEPPKADPVPAPVVEAPKPAVVGGGAGAAGAPPRPEIDVDEDPTAAIRRRRAGDLAKLRGGKAAEIVVVEGGYDRVQDVLLKLGVPHVVIEPERLGRAELPGCRALLINCHSAYQAYAMKSVDARTLARQIGELEKEAAELGREIERVREPREAYKLNVLHLNATSEIGRLRQRLEALSGSERIVERVRGVVERGGYAFTSDWGLSILEHAFPGHVSNGGFVGPRTVAIRPKGTHALLEEAFPSGAKAGRLLWEIDGSSYQIRVEREGVETLVESPEIGKHAAVAVVFRPAETAGKVLHLLSHFQRQATKRGDYALQNLLVNFLLDGSKR
jgi:hypothetical protein